MLARRHATDSQEPKEENARPRLEGEGGYRRLCGHLGIKKKPRSRVAGRGGSAANQRKRQSRMLMRGPETAFGSLEEKLACGEAGLEYGKKLQRSRFGHERGARKKHFFERTDGTRAPFMGLFPHLSGLSWSGCRKAKCSIAGMDKIRAGKSISGPFPGCAFSVAVAA